MTTVTRLLAAIVAAASTQVSAQDAEPRSGWYVGGHGVYSVLRDEVGTAGGTSFDVDTDSGFGLGLAAGYDFGGWRVELEGQQFANDYGDAAAAAVGSDDIQTRMIFANTWLSFLVDSEILPFVGVGIGMVGRDFDGASDSALGMQFGVGAEWRILDPLLLVGTARVFAAEDIDFTRGGQTFDMTHDGFLATLGARYEFGGPPPPPPAPEPVKVVEPLPACSDGQDNDNDGLVDHPDDPGCADAEDNNENDPCKTPELGEKIDLRGCGTGDRITLRGVNFELNKATLTADSAEVLDDVASQLVEYTNIHIEVGGHTDSTGSDSYNQGLSERRARSVREYLENQGVDPARLTSVGYGEADPVATNDTIEGRAENRRVELKIISAE